VIVGDTDGDDIVVTVVVGEESYCMAIGKSHHEYDSVGMGRCILMDPNPKEEEDVEDEDIVPNKGMSVDEVVVSSILYNLSTNGVCLCM